MRKINSEFKTAFTSEAGAEVINNDYFGFVELEDYACYVVADGLYQGADAGGAKIAIEAVIQKFMEQPSMRKAALKKYLKIANTRLVDAGKARERLKTSITVVVTNYESIRWASAGNTRMYLYRGGEVFERTVDTSLAQEKIENEGSSIDKLARHQDRNNLFSYLGQKYEFDPVISKKIRLKESDIITLFTRGIWENVTDGELSDVFAEAGDSPNEAVDVVEDLLLSAQASDLENYTFAAIYVNRIFEDPNRKKRRKKIIIIAIIAVVLLTILILVIFFWTRNRQQLRADMDDHITRTVSHIEQGNFSRALIDAEEADALARRLRDRSALADLDIYMQIIEAVLFGDSLIETARYGEAQEAFRRARGYAVTIGVGYQDITRRLETVEEYINFFSLMELADGLVAIGSYESALFQFNQARIQASNLFFSSGRQQALDAIADVHERMLRAENAREAAADAANAEREAELEEERQAAAERAAIALAAAELIARGDEAFTDGDYIAARAFFQLAREMYLDISDHTAAATAATRIALAESRMVSREDQEELANDFAARGEYHFLAGNLRDAQRYFGLARDIYSSLGQSWRVLQMEQQLEFVRQALEKQDERHPLARAS